MNYALREYVYKTKGLEKSMFPLNVRNISLVLYLTIHKTQYSLAPTYNYDIYKKLMICNLKGKLFLWATQMVKIWHFTRHKNRSAIVFDSAHKTPSIFR